MEQELVEEEQVVEEEAPEEPMVEEVEEVEEVEGVEEVEPELAEGVKYHLLLLLLEGREVGAILGSTHGLHGLPTQSCELFDNMLSTEDFFTLT